MKMNPFESFLVGLLVYLIVVLFLGGVAIVLPLFPDNNTILWIATIFGVVSAWIAWMSHA